MTKKVAIVTEPMKGAASDDGWRQEIRYRKYFFTDDYVVVQAGPFAEAYEIMASLEKEVKDRKAAKKVVRLCLIICMIRWMTSVLKKVVLIWIRCVF